MIALSHYGEAMITIIVPADEGAKVTEGVLKGRKSEGVTLVRREKDHAVYEIGSGTYYFTNTLTK